MKSYTNATPSYFVFYLWVCDYHIAQHIIYMYTFLILCYINAYNTFNWIEVFFLVRYRECYIINHDSSTHTSCSIYSSMTFVQTIHIKICIIYIFLRIVNTFTTYIYYMCIRYSYDCKIFHCINNCLFYIHNSNIFISHQHNHNNLSR